MFELISTAFAKFLMNLIPNEQQYNTAHPRSETIRHSDFITASDN